jgi:hypothetical protein
MTRELKRCPFCGGEAADPDGNNHTWCSETSCGSDAYLSVEAWNRRAEPGKPESGVLAVVVKVKPLIWEVYNIDMHKAETFFGYYVVAASGHCWLNAGPLAKDFESIGKNVDAAKGFCQADYEQRIMAALTTPPQPVAALHAAPCEPVAVKAFGLGDRVSKKSGSSWNGHVVGFYSTELTPIGYCVESEREPGSVQIYPEAALTGGADGFTGGACGQPVDKSP